MPDPVFTLRDFLIPALAGATSFVGAWIAAKLALSNFYQQNTWERKAEAYTAIFQALHAIDRWHVSAAV